MRPTKTALAIACAFALGLALLLAPALPAAHGEDGDPPNAVSVTFRTLEAHFTGADSVDDVIVTGSNIIGSILTNEADTTGAAVVGTIPGGGPTLDLAASSPVVSVLGVQPTSGSLPGTAFTWGFPTVAQSAQVGATAVLEGAASFSPGFTVTRSADVSTFGSAEGTQLLTVTVTPTEAVDSLFISGNVQPGGYEHYTASIDTVVWGTVPPAPASEFLVNANDFSITVDAPQVGFEYTLLVTSQVASNLSGVDIEFMPTVDVRSQVELDSSTAPESASSLPHVNAGGTWNWQAAGAYEWTWQDVALKVIHMNGRVGATANLAHAWFENAYHYNTDAGLLTNTELVGSRGLNVSLANPEDNTGADIVGSSGEGGPVLSLAANSTVDDVRQDYLTSGSTPGTEFTWGPPPIAQHSEEVFHAHLQGDASFTPGFDVQRSVNTTTFSSTPGIQVLTLEVIPREAMQRLNLQGNARPGGWEHYDATLLSAVWVDDPPADSNLESNATDFWGGINNPEVGTTYRVLVTIQVVSTLPGTDVDYMPQIDISNHVSTVPCSAPQSGGVLTHVMADGTWTLTGEGDYVWTWDEALLKNVHMDGYVTGPSNLLSVDFKALDTYDTDSSVMSVLNATREGSVTLITELTNLADGTGAPLTGAGGNGGPVLSLTTTPQVFWAFPAFLTSGAVPGNAFTWGPPAVAESESWGTFANLDKTVAFQPGFDVTRSVNTTTFTSAGGTQELTLTVTPREAMDELSILGIATPGGWEYCTVNMTSAGWVGAPPAAAELTTSPNLFQATIENPQVDVPYQILMTTEVASSIPGVDIEYMPLFGIHKENDGAGSVAPVVASHLEGGTADGTWDWQADGDYAWLWQDVTGTAVNLGGGITPNGDFNLVHAWFENTYHYNTDSGLLTNTELLGSRGLSVDLDNPEDSTGADIVGLSGEGGPILHLAANSTVDDVRWEYLTSDPPPGTEFTWGPPSIAQNTGEGFYAHLQGDVSFTPGFDVERSVSTTTFSSTPGTQVLTLAVTPREAMQRLNLNGNVRPGGWEHYDATLLSAEWVGDPPANSNLDSDGTDFWGGIDNPEVGITYTVRVTIEVVSTLPGIDVDYMPQIDISNHVSTVSSDGAQSGSGLTHVMTDGTFTWTAQGDYLWIWDEAVMKTVHLDGHASAAGNLNLVDAAFNVAWTYNTDGDSVTASSLDGYIQLNTNIYNADDGSDGQLTGLSAEDGPVLSLDTGTETVTEVRYDRLASGSVPGNAFTFDYPAFGEYEGDNCFANLDGVATFEPGFSVSRSPNTTTFDFSGGDQVLTVTARADVPMERLSISGNVPGGYGYFAAALTGVPVWVGEDIPASYDLDWNPDNFWGGINNPEVGVTYTLQITSHVASTIEGVEVTYMPDIDVRNSQNVDHSTEPESGSLSRTLSDGSSVFGTWTWTAEGTYLWNWDQSASTAIHLNGYVRGDVNEVGVSFDTSQNYDTDADSVSNVVLDGYTNLSTNLHNQDDSTDADVTGTGAEGGPTLALAATSTVGNVWGGTLTGGSVPGTDFAWDLPVIPENNGNGCGASLDGAVSFTPGFSVSRTVDVDTFDSVGGTQHVTLTVTPEEPMERFNLNGNVWVGGGDYTASLMDVAWVDAPPASYDLDWNADGFWGGINNPEVGTTYELLVTISVASTIPGVDVTYMPSFQIGNQHQIASSGGPQSGSGLTHVIADGAWTWTATGTYLWCWNETTTRTVSLNGYARSNANYVHASFDTVQRYDTADNIVANSSLDGYLNVSTNLHNQPDDTGAPVTGTSPDGGPLLDLTTNTSVNATRDDRIVTGTVPGTAFTFGLPAVDENNGENCWANLEGVSTFTPGFTVTRSSGNTTFDNSGGTQQVILTVIPTESMDSLFISGYSNPGGWDYYTARFTSVGWWGAAPAGTGAPDWNDDNFWISIDNPQTGYAYQLVINVEVASTLAGVDITYMTGIEVSNQHHVGNSGVPTADTSFSRSTAEADWTWQSDQALAWNWNETTSKVVNLQGYVGGTANFVHGHFETAQMYGTNENSVANTELEGSINTSANLHNQDDSTGEPVTGLSPDDGPLLDLTTTIPVEATQEDRLLTSPPPGTAFTFGFPAFDQGNGDGCWANLEGVVSFTPGFSVERLADFTTFDSGGGTQTLTLTLTPEEIMDHLQINGMSQPGGSASYIASFTNAAWGTAPPPGTNDPEWNGDNFWVTVDDPQVGFVYTLVVTTTVASGDPAVDVVYRPHVDIRNQHDVASSGFPESGTSCGRTIAGGTCTWNWQATGAYQWDWREVDSRAVLLFGGGEPEATATVTLTPGWNLVAGASRTVFPAGLFGWTGTTYVSRTDPVAWSGYWCKVAEPATVDLETVDGPYTIPLSNGWNLIGNPMATTATLTLPPLRSAFAWTGTAYESVTSLAPGQGAWVKGVGGEEVIILTP